MDRVWREWTIATTVGELAGFAVPAAVGVAIFTVGAEPSGVGAPLAGAAIVAAGVGEGAVLGVAQARVLRSRAPEIDATAWIRNTAAAAGVAWVLGLLPNTVGDAAGSQTVTMVMWVAVAPLLLVSIPCAQWLVLRDRVPAAWRWIPAGVVGWLAGLPIPFAAMAALPDDASPAVRIAAGVASGCAMGAVVGAVTGRTLVRLLRAGTGRRPRPLARRGAGGRAAMRRAG